MEGECPDTLVFAGFVPRALVAQRIEQKTSNLLAAGSIPAEGAPFESDLSAVASP